MILEIKGPYYYKVLKDGEIRFVKSKPKGPHIELISETIDFFGQHKWYYMDAVNGQKIYKCDFENRCGYDRGPRFENLIKRMMRRVS